MIDTSKAAYDSVKGGIVKEHHRKILEALSSVECANFDEISAITGIDRIAIARRLSELMNDEKIYRTNIKRPTKTGSAAYCLAIAGSGLPKYEEKKKEEKKTAKETKAKPVANADLIPVRAYVRQKHKKDIPKNQEKLFDF